MNLCFDVEKIKILLSDVFVRELASATNTTPHLNDVTKGNLEMQ